MKKIIYSLILILVVVSGLLFANRENKNFKKSISKPPTAAEIKASRVKWEASPDGIMFKKWEASPAGKKVYAAEAKIRKSIKDSTKMEAVVTSLSIPLGSRVGFGVMVSINEEDYILAMVQEKSKDNLNFKKEYEQLHSLKVNDKIFIKSNAVMHAPKYVYPIVMGNYIERDGKVIYKRTPRKVGC